MEGGYVCAYVFTLRNKPEWQRGCGINLPPRDPLVLALEKDRGKRKMRWCSACSIGQKCLKLRDREEEDSEVDLLELQSNLLRRVPGGPSLIT